MTVILVLAKLITGYRNYKVGHRQETNLAMVCHLRTELGKVARNLDRTMGASMHGGGGGSKRDLAALRDEADLLARELATLELGGRRTFAREQSLLDNRTLKELMEVDAGLYRSLASVEAATSDLLRRLGQGGDPLGEEEAAVLMADLEAFQEGLMRRRRVLGGIALGQADSG